MNGYSVYKPWLLRPAQEEHRKVTTTARNALWLASVPVMDLERALKQQWPSSMTIQKMWKDLCMLCRISWLWCRYSIHERDGSVPLQTYLSISCGGFTSLLQGVGTWSYLSSISTSRPLWHFLTHLLLELVEIHVKGVLLFPGFWTVMQDWCPDLWQQLKHYQ